jgi:hypothetical protein
MSNSLTATELGMAHVGPITPGPLKNYSLRDELLRPFKQCLQAALDCADEGCTGAMHDAADELENASVNFGADISNEHEAFCQAYAALLRYMAKDADEPKPDDSRESLADHNYEQRYG